MKRTYYIIDEADYNAKWQMVTISDECGDEKDGCKYSLEIVYAKSISILDKQQAIENLIHVISTDHPPVNFQVSSADQETIKIIGNLEEILFHLGTNRYIHDSILSQIEHDVEIKKILKESSDYLLPSNIDLSKIQLRDPTIEDFEDFGITNALSTPATHIKKIGLFEPRNNTSPSNATSTSNSVTNTPENKVNTTAEGTSPLPPTSPTTIKVK